MIGGRSPVVYHSSIYRKNYYPSYCIIYCSDFEERSQKNDKITKTSKDVNNSAILDRIVRVSDKGVNHCLSVQLEHLPSYQQILCPTLSVNHPDGLLHYLLLIFHPLPCLE